MDVKLAPGSLAGTLPAIPSKSDAHRVLICAALADRPTALRLPRTSADIDTTCACLEALGAGIARRGDTVTVSPIRDLPERALLDCGESGSTLRFLLPVAAALCPRVRFTGRGRLPERPIGELKAAMYAQRGPLYARFRDAAIDNNGTAEDTAAAIWRDFCEHSGD